MQRDAVEFLGPEIVSPHYESFFHSRKWGLSFIAGFGVLQIVANSKDLPHFAASVMPAYLFWSLTFYFFLEAKSSLIKPLLFQFHTQICEHEKMMVLSYWNDNMREFLQRRISQAKEQIDYYNVHEDYYSIKAESINRVGTSKTVPRHRASQPAQPHTAQSSPSSPDRRADGNRQPALPHQQHHQ